MSIKKQLGYSGLTQKIFLAKMKDHGNGTKTRIGNEPPEDVTNECFLMVCNLLKDKGGTAKLDLGSVTVRLTLEETTNEQ